MRLTLGSTTSGQRAHLQQCNRRLQAVRTQQRVRRHRPRSRTSSRRVGRPTFLHNQASLQVIMVGNNPAVSICQLVTKNYLMDQFTISLSENENHLCTNLVLQSDRVFCLAVVGGTVVGLLCTILLVSLNTFHLHHSNILTPHMGQFSVSPGRGKCMFYGIFFLK